MHGMGLGSPGKTQGRHQIADTDRLIIERGGNVFQPPTREAPGWRLLERGALPCCLCGVVRQQEVQASAPFDQRGARFWHHPWDRAHGRKIQAAAQATRTGQPASAGGAGQQVCESLWLRHDADHAALSAVVVTAAAVYSPAMPGSGESQVYRVEPGPATASLRFRSGNRERARFLDIAQYQGPKLPAVLTDPAVEALGDSGRALPSWRISCAEGQFEFQALAIEQIEECRALYEPLHERFRLSRSDRLAVRVLLWLLRLPGGAGLLRRWHAHRQ